MIAAQRERERLDALYDTAVALVESEDYEHAVRLIDEIENDHPGYRGIDAFRRRADEALAERAATDADATTAGSTRTAGPAPSYEPPRPSGTSTPDDEGRSGRAGSSARRSWIIAAAAALAAVLITVMVVALRATPTGTALHRVNVGGPAVATTDSGPDWSFDTLRASSPYWVEGGFNVYDTSSPGSTDDVTSGPADVPLEVFNSERWDAQAAPTLSYSFPVEAGTELDVKVYVAEIFAGITAAGQRVFDIAVDGVVPPAFEDIDPYALGGDQSSVGSVVSTSIVSDGSVDLTFLHQSEMPNPKAIELVTTS